jgi:hypothetical protein
MKETGCQNVNSIRLALYKTQRRTRVNMMMKLQAQNLLISWAAISSLRISSLHGP